MRSRMWMILTFGPIRWWRYERARKAGATLDYSRVFSPQELAELEKAGLAMWPTVEGEDPK